MCPYCLEFQIARVYAAKANMTFWKLTVENDDANGDSSSGYSNSGYISSCQWYSSRTKL